MPSKYLPHKIHLTSHSIYGGETQESFLISPILGVGGLGFSGSHHVIHYVSFLFENICLWVCYQWFVTSTLESTLVSSIKGNNDTICSKRFVQKYVPGSICTRIEPGTYSREHFTFAFFAWEVSLRWTYSIHGPMRVSQPFYLGTDPPVPRLLNLHLAGYLLSIPPGAPSPPELPAKKLLFYLILTTTHDLSPY